MIRRWLAIIPVAVLSAMLGPDLLLQRGELALTFTNDYLWAGLAALTIGIWRKNLALTVLTGIVVVGLLRVI